jgi:hypothetical protein
MFLVNIDESDVMTGARQSATDDASDGADTDDNHAWAH